MLQIKSTPAAFTSVAFIEAVAHHEQKKRQKVLEQEDQGLALDGDDGVEARDCISWRPPRRQAPQEEQLRRTSPQTRYGRAQADSPHFGSTSVGIEFPLRPDLEQKNNRLLQTVARYALFFGEAVDSSSVARLTVTQSKHQVARLSSVASPRAPQQRCHAELGQSSQTYT